LSILEGVSNASQRNDVLEAILTDSLFLPLTATNSEWYGEIDVGTPATAFSVVLDTGSADLILAEPSCSGCESTTPGYDPSTSSTSSTSESTFSITYGSGSGSGSLVKDTISIANYTQPNQIFAACSTLDNIVDGTISGILGLGWQQIASSQAVPLVESLANNGTLPEQVFGFAFECVLLLFFLSFPSSLLSLLAS
jgi:cathepsin D